MPDKNRSEETKNALPARIKTTDRGTFMTYYLWKDDSAKKAWLFFSYDSLTKHEHCSGGDIFPCKGIAMNPAIARMMGESRLGAELGDLEGSRRTEPLFSPKIPTSDEEESAKKAYMAEGSGEFKPGQWRDSPRTYSSDYYLWLRCLMLEAYEEAQGDIERESHLPESQRRFAVRKVATDDFFAEVDRLKYDLGYSFPLVDSELASAKRKKARKAKAAKAAD
jgi:hypothetical protein